MIKASRIMNWSPFFWLSCTFISAIMMKACPTPSGQVSILTSLPMMTSLIFWSTNVLKNTLKTVRKKTNSHKNMFTIAILLIFASITALTKLSTNYPSVLPSKHKIWSCSKDSTKWWSLTKWLSSFYHIYWTLISPSESVFWIWLVKEFLKNLALLLNISTLFKFFKLRVITKQCLKLFTIVQKEDNSRSHTLWL